MSPFPLARVLEETGALRDRSSPITEGRVAPMGKAARRARAPALATLPRMRLTILLLAIPLLVACGDDEASGGGSGSAEEASPTFQPIAGGVGWSAEPPLMRTRPANDMREAQYDVTGHPGTSLAISHFDPEVGGGGDVEANVERWVHQFQQPDGSEARVTQRTVNDLRVTTVDVHGTFVGRQGMGTGAPPRADWRMLGAIAEGSEGLVFFKLLGPEAGVTAAEQAFEELVRSIHPE